VSTDPPSFIAIAELERALKTQTLIEILVQDAFHGRDFGRSVKTAFTIGNLVAGLVFFFAIGVRADVSYAVRPTISR
jgi:hypothetical protein